MSTIDARKRWARSLITRPGRTVPAYGTAEWLALPEGDVAKVAAVVRAAECWATQGDDLEMNLRVEVEALRLAHKHEEDAEYQAGRDAHRKRWARMPGDVDRAERRNEQRRLWLVGGEAS